MLGWVRRASETFVTGRLVDRPEESGSKSSELADQLVFGRSFKQKERLTTTGACDLA
jgi:hypothetical protein